MSNLKNRINVDEKLAEIMREHYRCTTSTGTLAALCFSNPQLQSHCCNKMEKLDGGHKCTYCQHDPLKLCEYSCDVSKACLAAFAYRLGVGGDKLHTAVKKNLEMPYTDLLTRIRTALSGDVPMAEVKMVEAANKVEAEAETPQAAPEPEAKPAAIPSLAQVPDEDDGLPTDLITVKDAAEIWGCTAPNIYAKIGSGRIKTYTQGGSPTKLVSRTAIQKLKKATAKG